MTSPLNHVETIAHFEENQFFVLNQQMICFFPQAINAAMDTQGRELREAPDRLALVPDGNGGCFRALSRSGCLDWLASHGVRFIFLYSVDNVLVKICDPFFLGALACTPDMQSASKVVSKRSADEKVGIFAFRNGKPSVVEYTDLPPALRDAKTTEGGLQFDGGNIAVHLFRLEALRKLENKPLPWHAAFKKISFWTPDGISQPAEPNAWKFEQFLFDAFPILGSMIPFGVEREDEFAPVKNATVNDSPASARKMIGELHRNWLTRAKSPVAPNTLYEISPLLSYAGEGLDGAMLESRLGTDIWSFQE
jgi:UDP-N-acetylglucosamine/UDP-N-acetylgalactosamine diphosphorylase